MRIGYGKNILGQSNPSQSKYIAKEIKIKSGTYYEILYLSLESKI